MKSSLAEFNPSTCVPYDPAVPLWEYIPEKFTHVLKGDMYEEGYLW